MKNPTDDTASLKSIFVSLEEETEIIMRTSDRLLIDFILVHVFSGSVCYPNPAAPVDPSLEP